MDPDDDDDDNLCTVIVSLMQKGRRALRDEGLDTLTIGTLTFNRVKFISHKRGKHTLYVEITVKNN